MRNGGRTCRLSFFIFHFSLFILLAWAATAQLARVGQAKGFKLPDYYPARNGVQQIKTLLTGAEVQFSSNGMVLLTEPRITNYTESGEIDWTVSSSEATANWLTHSASGTNHVVFRSADGNLFVRARGFLWQQTNSLLILSNETLTWIDKSAFTNHPVTP